MDNPKQGFQKMNSIIEQIYIGKDYALFRRLASQPDFVLSGDVTVFLGNEKVKTQCCNTIASDTIFPATDWNFNFPKVMIGKCPTFMETYLAISKICNIFYIEHKFELEDTNPESPITSSFLEGNGYNGRPITYLQAELETLLKKQMTEQGFEQLEVGEAKITYPNLINKELARISNTTLVPQEYFQVTYWDLLFRDVMDIL